MLQSIKTQGSYEGIEYDHKGPAHLSIGQEASAVGQAFLLGVDDHIFGSHRSHGEILAKGMSAIRKLDDDSLLEIMTGFLGGDCYRVVEKEESSSVKDLARNFLLIWALLPKSLAGRTDSTADWADRCMPFFLLSVFFRTMPSWRICGYSHGGISCSRK